MGGGEGERGGGGDGLRGRDEEEEAGGADSAFDSPCFGSSRCCCCGSLSASLNMTASSLLILPSSWAMLSRISARYSDMLRLKSCIMLEATVEVDGDGGPWAEAASCEAEAATLPGKLAPRPPVPPSALVSPPFSAALSICWDFWRTNLHLEGFLLPAAGGPSASPLLPSPTPCCWARAALWSRADVTDLADVSLWESSNIPR